MATPAELAWAVFPGGSLGEYGRPAGLTAVLARGEGTTVCDTHEWAFLDCMMGWGPVLLGHAPPAVTEAARR
jgi:glutamate-1-semialdehyde 2,1-aminomutase